MEENQKLEDRKGVGRAARGGSLLIFFSDFTKVFKNWKIYPMTVRTGEGKQERESRKGKNQSEKQKCDFISNERRKKKMEQRSKSESNIKQRDLCTKQKRGKKKQN